MVPHCVCDHRVGAGGGQICKCDDVRPGRTVSRVGRVQVAVEEFVVTAGESQAHAVCAASPHFARQVRDSNPRNFSRAICQDAFGDRAGREIIPARLRDYTR